MLLHPSLNAKFNPVIVHDSPQVLQYRNIPYAWIPERFRNPKRIDDFGGREVGGVKHGPRCPQVPYNLTSLFRVDEEWAESEDELQCLNLHVTVPGNHVKENDSVPVMVFIHGGSFVATVGSPDTDTADPTRLVAASVAGGTPIIFVGFNYRVGLLGFTRLSEEEGSFGFHDQRCLLEWVQRNIGGFGGDPKRVTLFGESAGSISTHYHILSSLPPRLFSRAIFMSGHALTVPPQSPSVVDSVVTAPLLEKLGITRGENEEWKRQLREVPVDRIIQAQIELGINALFPSDEILPEGINLYKLPEWLETVMIGDTAYEGCLWSKAVAELSSVEGLLQMFPDTAAAEKIRAAYGIQPYVEFDELRRKVLSFIGDVKFGFHTEQLYQTFRQQRKNVLRYHMDAINPYDEKAGAHHCVDLIYLFRHEGEVAERMREIWIRFAYGLDSEEMIVLGERKGRREGMYRVLREVSESDLAQVTRAVTGGRIAFDVVDI